MDPQLSIKAKLRQVILITTGVVLVLTALSFIANEMVSFRRAYLQRMTTIAEVVAGNVTSSLAFRDENDAQNVLASLRAEPNILRAVLYDSNGQVFARYPASLPSDAVPAQAPNDGERYTRDKLIVARSAVQEKRVGTLYLEADLGPLYNRLQFYMLMVAGVLAGSLLVAFVLSAYLEKQISDPILSLAGTAREISEGRDYSTRAIKTSHDEIGALTDSFNDMLNQIESRDAALQHSADRLRLALEGSQAGTWDWDLRSKKVAWDEFASRLYGMKPGEFKGTYESFLEAIHPADRASVERALKRALEKRREFVIESRVVWPDGSLHYLASRGKAFYDEKGQPVRMTGMTIDVTETKRAEQSLRESEERFRAMADAAPVLIWTSRPNKEWDYFNRAWLDFTGRKIEQELGFGWTELLHPEIRARVVEVYNKSFDVRMPFIMELQMRRGDGQYRWLLNHGVPRFAPDGTFQGYIGSCLDITERKQMQVELEQRVQARTAELAETNRELESFTYSVSHDLRSPLRHINAYAQILQEDFGQGLPAEAVNYIERIRSGAKNMGVLVDDLLNLARVGRQELAREAVDINAIVRAIALELMDDQPGRQIEWRIATLTPAEGDAGLIKQVFTNLLSNAVKYTRPKPVAVIEVGEFQQNGERVISVKDNGVGFNQKYAAKLFGVFQRLHRADEFEGTGVGLAIVERIIRKHGGKIWAEAELDKGATFYFTLPASNMPNPPPERAA
jgi:PAS domain S-box-containing protein